MNKDVQMNTKDKGDVTEAMVLSALVKAGKTVLKPWGDNKRYDLVIDEGDQFVRIQCKTGRLRDGSVIFKAASFQTNRGNNVVKKDYIGQADKFGVYCPDNGKVYLVPVVLKSEVALRVEPTSNNQRKRIRWAKDYEIER